MLYDISVDLYIQCVYKVSFIQGSVQQILPYFSSSGYNGSLITLTVIRLISAKFKPFIFSVSGFVLSNIANMCILMIRNDLCLLPALFGYIIVHVRNL
jgi:hypothetical protein